MVSTLAPLVALLISIFTLMLGNGLINILLPVRMRLDGVETDTIGLVLSLYAVGMLVGGLYSRHLIVRAGHIRMFAASAAIGSVSILICGLISDALLWGAMRILMGFSNAVALGLDFPLKSAAREGEIAGGPVGSPMCLRIALIEAVAVPAGEWGNFEQ